ncbi:MAG: thioesterase superfamily protein [Bacillales bacterium]|jgi:uncharacterized protein (TIGR00369 family)|nr:thioesterase superfamily protein [Bacillales bacterium]
MEKSLIGLLGIKIEEVSEGYVLASMPVDDRTRQPFGFLHGGASVALAETAASVGAYNLIDKENEIAFGLEINANHIKSKKSGVVRALATVLHKGKSTMVWEIRIVDEDDDLICISRCTIAVVKKK